MKQKDMESAVRVVGYRLSCVAYNWGQQPGYVLTPRDCDKLSALAKEWDAATSVLEEHKRKLVRSRRATHLAPPIRVLADRPRCAGDE